MKDGIYVTSHYANFVIGEIIGWLSSARCVPVYGVWLAGLFYGACDGCCHFKPLLLLYLVLRYTYSVKTATSQLVSEHIPKPPVVIFYLHAGEIAPRNSAQHGRRTYGKHAVWKSSTTMKLLNGTNVRPKRTVNSSHDFTFYDVTSWPCDELTGSR